MIKLDYHPDRVARSLRTQKTHSIGLIISDISNPFFSVLVRGAEDAAAEQGYSVIIANTDEDLEKERLYVNVLRQRRIDGLLIAPTGQLDEDLEFLTSSRIPFVFVDRRIEGVAASAFLSDNIEGAFGATRHLIEHGHARIGIILGLHGVSSSEERYLGYQRALRESRIAADPQLVVRGDLRIPGGVRACNELLDLPSPPTAIFSLNNLTAIGVLCAIKEHGLRYPDDVSVISFDSPWWMERVLSPSLTYVRQDPYEIGRQAMRRLIEELESHASEGLEKTTNLVRIPTELVLGESVRGLGDEARSQRASRLDVSASSEA
ncbi:LacI family DNA-binding transcriptional regulator [Candidatus Bipolaricaulota bacterium]|nr:LacI family DNA-binding transcriptional regulator [Candidatus Bipolaricaulota bacterium]